MARITLDITMSLDGFVAGPEPSMEDPLGKRGMELHGWVFRLATWRQSHGMEGGETGPDADLVAEHSASYRAVVMGRRMYSGGAGPWEADPNASGWWGEDPPFHVPVFVLTHHPRESVEMQGGTTFHFVTDGIDAALDRAQEAAGDTAVHVAGGADVAQQALAAGRFDELTIHVAPVLLGSGTRLFETSTGAASSSSRCRCRRHPPSRTCATGSSRSRVLDPLDTSRHLHPGRQARRAGVVRLHDHVARQGVVRRRLPRRRRSCPAGRSPASSCSRRARTRPRRCPGRHRRHRHLPRRPGTVRRPAGRVGPHAVRDRAGRTADRFPTTIDRRGPHHAGLAARPVSRGPPACRVSARA